MTGPGTRASGRPGGEEPDLSQFALAEKLAAEWEARHFAAARRTGGLGVPQYLAHERCTEACSSGHHGHRREPAATSHRSAPGPGTTRAAPPDVRPHLSDWWGWLGGGGGGGGGGRRDDRRR